MRSFSTVLLSALIVSLMIGCASTVKFNVRDKASGQPISNYSVRVDDKTYSSGETAQLNRAIWKKYSATVEAEGYEPGEYQIKKEIIPELLIGGIIFWPAWAWCYGPSDVQEFYLSDATRQMPSSEPMMSENPAAGQVR